MLDGGQADIAMATNFGTQFAINIFMGYNFGCMIGSDSLFDSRGGFLGSSYPMKTQARLSIQRSLGRCHGNQFWN